MQIRIGGKKASQTKHPSEQTLLSLQKCSVAARFAGFAEFQHYELIGIESWLDMTQNDMTLNFFMSFQFVFFADWLSILNVPFVHIT